MAAAKKNAARDNPSGGCMAYRNGPIHTFPVNNRDTRKPPQFKRSQQTAGKQKQGKGS